MQIPESSRLGSLGLVLFRKELRPLFSKLYPYSLVSGAHFSLPTSASGLLCDFGAKYFISQVSSSPNTDSV